MSHSVFVDSETIAASKRVRIEGLKKIGFGVLSVFPVDSRSGQIGVERVAEDLEKGVGRCRTCA